MPINSKPCLSLCPLIARESELETLVRLWRTSRLVTLYGQSGVGKSALAAAAALAAESRHRVVMRDASRAESVLAVLRLLASARRRLPRPAAVDPARPLFVLLDHLPVALHGAASGLLKWLVTHPDIHLLVVSRRPLQLVGEQTLALKPLAVPSGSDRLSPAAQCLQRYARWASPVGHPLSDEAITAIAAELAGLPEALEAAAGLAGALPEAEIVRIAREDPLSLTLRGVALRSRLAATIDDLPADARAYLLANARWPESFDDSAAAQLWGGDSPAMTTAYLLQMGLLEVVGHNPHLRYQIPGLVRRAITERTGASSQVVKERMAHCLLARVEHSSTEELLARIRSELPALRWAWRWLAGAGEGEAVFRIARALAGPLGRQHGDAQEAAELLQSALAWARVSRPDAVSCLEAELGAAEEVRLASRPEPLQPDLAASRMVGRPSPPAKTGCASTPPLLIRLLGPLRVDGSAGPLSRERLRPKEQRVLARLALEPGQLIPRDELLELFWPHSHPRASERSLRTVVSSLRAGLRTVLDGRAVPLITGRMEGYRLEAAACAVDVVMFSRAVEEAREASATHSLAAWRRAVDLYEGDLLCNFPYDDWCLGLRERLRIHLQDGLYCLARAALHSESLEETRDLALRMVGLDPAEERAYRLLMRCFARMGCPGEAVRQFERCREALWEELGAQPAYATVALHESLRAGYLALDEEWQADGEPDVSPARIGH